MKEKYNKNKKEKDRNEWKQIIRDVYNDMSKEIQFLYPNNSTEVFLTSIWKASVGSLDGREVMVIVDNKYNLYISCGTELLVSFNNHEYELKIGNKMQLPLRCCIHTHPSGKAYFSDTDWITINTWKNDIESCIVLGNNEYIAYNTKSKLAKMVYYGRLEEGLRGVQ